jgi:NitT/TauT family transport system substrate-binding protein
MDLMTREWLVQNGVAIKQVGFVEVPLPNSPDVLRAKSVDAIVSFGAQMQRLTANKLGTRVSDFTAQAGEGQSTTLFATTVEWAKKNPATVQAFKAAAKDAADFVHSNPDKAQMILSASTKLALDDIKAIGLPAAKAEITPSQIRWWQELMTRQGLLTGKFDPATAVVQ